MMRKIGAAEQLKFVHDRTQFILLRSGRFPSLINFRSETKTKENPVAERRVLRDVAERSPSMTQLLVKPF